MAFREGETCDGHVIVYFDLISKDYDEEEVYLDFHGKGVERIVVNGKKQPVAKYFGGHRIVLSKLALHMGRNTIKILFKSAYRTNGTGMHSFIDKADGNQYLWTQFEYFHCH